MFEPECIFDIISPIMVSERELTGEVQASTLPVPDFNAFCKQLFNEGLDYDQLPEGIVETVGTHTSIVLHDYPEREGRWMSIHFRENLESLARIETPTARARAFFI